MSYNVICDRCGFKYKDHELKKEWQGLMVCEPCWEPRHPLDMVRARPDQKPLPYTRPEPAEVNTDVTYADTTTDVPSGTFNNEL